LSKANRPSVLPFTPSVSSEAEAFAVCERLTKDHYENFSVATRLMPDELQKHFYSIYAFCRGVDDLGDEFEGDRLDALNAWEAELESAYSREATHPFFIALQSTIKQFDIPREPFLRLIEANRRDQTITRHQTFDDVLEYCTYSADPVGHLVLYLLNHKEPQLHELSNFTCTALQLANFWQDVSRDYDMGRIYIPQETLDQFGVSESDIAAKTPTRAFKAAIKFEVDRARDYFIRGLPLIDHIEGKAKIDIALFSAGGISVLNKIEQQDYDVLTSRPKLSKFEKVRMLASTYIRAKLGFHPLSKAMRN
jgi:squalene synthase HpnC